VVEPIYLQLTIIHPAGVSVEPAQGQEPRSLKP